MFPLLVLSQYNPVSWLPAEIATALLSNIFTTIGAAVAVASGVAVGSADADGAGCLSANVNLYVKIEFPSAP